MTITTTTWHRLEPRVRGNDPAVGIAARVHDPLWLLGRQWQLGELLGEDAAFPVAVTVQTAEFPLTRFAAADGTVSDYDTAAVPLEVLVERAPQAAPSLRLRLDAWSRLRSLLTAAGLQARLAALAAAHPLPPPHADEDPSDARLRTLAGKAGDGAAIATSLAADAAGLPADLVGHFLDWFAAQTAGNRHDCWITTRLEHRFAVSAMTDQGESVLAADNYADGRLDWYAVDCDTDAAHTLSPPPAQPTPAVAHLLPTRVTFPGMPAERFWELEDSAVNLCAITASAEDLGRLLTVEFATVFGNDWWNVPVPARFGSLISVRSLVVHDTFGESVLIEPTERAAATRATAPWRMFRQTDPTLAAGSGPAPNLLLLAPVIAGALDGDAIEEVLLLRDEMANMAWAVERVVEGADGRPRNRSVEYGTRLSAAPLPQISSPADLAYVLQTSVPEHWIPLIPVRDPAHPTATSAVVLQRGTMLDQTVTAQGTILAPDVHPWYFHEEEVPSAGLRVRRIPSVARWLDGTPFGWVSRRVSTGKGEGSSGLRFDIAIPPAP
jgi:hypothetical protein